MKYVPLCVTAVCYGALGWIDAVKIEIGADLRTALLLLGAAGVAKMGWRNREPEKRPPGV